MLQRINRPYMSVGTDDFTLVKLIKLELIDDASCLDLSIALRNRERPAIGDSLLGFFAAFIYKNSGNNKKRLNIKYQGDLMCLASALGDLGLPIKK